MHSGIYPQTKHLQQNNTLAIRNGTFLFRLYRLGAAYKKKKKKEKKRKKVAHRVSSYFSISLELAKSFISQI